MTIFYVLSNSLFFFPPQFIDFTKVENIFWEKGPNFFFWIYFSSKQPKYYILTYNLNIWNSDNLKTSNFENKNKSKIYCKMQTCDVYN
jgi:hypothetical protein